MYMHTLWHLCLSAAGHMGLHCAGVLSHHGLALPEGVSHNDGCSRPLVAAATALVAVAGHWLHNFLGSLGPKLKLNQDKMSLSVEMNSVAARVERYTRQDNYHNP